MPVPRPPLTSIYHAQIKVKALLLSTGAIAKEVTTLFTYKRTSNVNTPSKTQLNTAFVAGPLAAFLAATNISYSNPTVSIRWLEDAEDPFVDFANVAAGAIATDRQPGFAAVYMALYSNSRALWAKSSKHFPGVNEIDTTQDLLTGAGLARWQTVQSAILANVTDAGPNIWQPCVVAGAPRSQTSFNPTTIVSNLVSSIVLHLSVGRMKKRQVKTVI
jgi:hypothetical protein